MRRINPSSTPNWTWTKAITTQPICVVKYNFFITNAKANDLLTSLRSFIRILARLRRVHKSLIVVPLLIDA